MLIIAQGSISWEMLLPNCPWYWRCGNVAQVNMVGSEEYRDEVMWLVAFFSLGAVTLQNAVPDGRRF